MKISIERNILLKLLSHVQNVVEKRNTIPILSNILINAKVNSVTLSATDMDLSITETVNSTVIEEGSITTPAQTLYEIVRKIQEGSDIELISNDGNKLSVRSGKSKFSLACLPKDDFPKIDEVKLEDEFVIKNEILGPSWSPKKNNALKTIVTEKEATKDKETSINGTLSSQENYEQEKTFRRKFQYFEF